MTMIDREFSWPMEPFHAKLFWIFLAIVCLITSVRIVRLAWALFGAGRHGRLSLGNVITQPI